MNRRIVTYLPGNATSSHHIPAPFDIATVPGAELTHLIYCFAGFTQQGVTWDPKWPEPHDAEPGDKRSNISKLIALKERWPSLRILISIGGWHNSHDGDPSYKTTPAFSAVAATPASRQDFVSSCIELFIKPGYPGLGRLFDGIDIDWEYPARADRHNLTLLLQEFRQQLDRAGFADERQLYLTAANTASSVGDLEVSSVASTLDWVDLMAYNAHRPNRASRDKFTDFGAPLFSSSAEPPSNVTWNVDSVVKALVQAGLPAQKLVLGVSAYGRTYAGVANINNGLYQTYNGPGPGQAAGALGTLTYGEIVSQYLDGSSGYSYFSDQTTRSDYLFSPAHQVWISYENAETVYWKSLYAGKLGLAGLMLWDISADSPSLFPGGQAAPVASLVDMMWTPIAIASFDKHVVSDNSNSAPALCSHSGCLFLAWTEAGNQRLSVMYSADNGTTFEGKVTSPEISIAAPTLASHDRLNVKTPPQHNLRIAWPDLPGTTSPNVLNVARVPLSANSSGTFGGIGHLTSKNVLTGTSSTAAPALASLGGRLFLAWKSLDNDDLNIMFSSDDGAAFEGETVLERSDVGPALVSHTGNLYMGWRARVTGNLNVAQVLFSTDSSGTFQGIEALTGVTSLAETSSSTPALCSHNGHLFVAWRGPGNATAINVMFSYDDGATFVGKKSFGNTNTAPALASHDGNLFMAWRGAGTDDGLSVAQILVGTAT